MAIREVVPVRNDVVDRTARLAERNAAVHAARTLLRRFILLERLNELVIGAHTLVDRQRHLVDAGKLHESGDLAHYATCLCLAAACLPATCLT